MPTWFPQNCRRNTILEKIRKNSVTIPLQTSSKIERKLSVSCVTIEQQWKLLFQLELSPGPELLNDQQLSEADLAARVQNNAPGAFEEMVRMYQTDVRIMTRRHLNSAIAADEIAQEVFVQLFRSIAGFRGNSSLRTWILGVTRNQIRLYLRNETRRKRRSAVVMSPELLEAEQAVTVDDPFRLEDATHELRALRNCLEKLSGRPRQVVEDFYFKKRSAESIAADRQQTPAAVRMFLMRVRKRLGECIRSQINELGEADQ